MLHFKEKMSLNFQIEIHSKFNKSIQRSNQLNTNKSHFNQICNCAVVLNFSRMYWKFAELQYI